MASIQVGPRDRKSAILLVIAAVNAIGYVLSDHWGFAIGFFFGMLGFLCRIADMRAERRAVEHNRRIHRRPIAATGMCAQCVSARKVRK